MPKKKIMDFDKNTKILIIGFGSIGQRHFKNLRKMGFSNFALLRSTKNSIKSTEYSDLKEFFSYSEAFDWQPKVVFVTNVTSEHVKSVTIALKNGCSVFVEKPLSDTLIGLNEIESMINQNESILYVGFNMRFHPAIKAIKNAVENSLIGKLKYVRAEIGQYLPFWHPKKDYRTEYTAIKEQGGGAFLTLMHEIDYVTWIAGEISSSKVFKSKISDLEISTDDVADIFSVHKSGAVSSVHMDFLDFHYNRNSKWIGSMGSIYWKWNNPVCYYDGNANEKIIFHDPDYNLNQTYIDELEDFFNAVFFNMKPIISAFDVLKLQKSLFASHKLIFKE